MATLGSDPSELAIPWQVLTAHGHQVIFATPDGKQGGADPRMLTGAGLSVLKPVLRADRRARDAYAAMAATPAFTRPLAYAEMNVDYDALILPGGHDKPIRAYLESEAVQAVTRSFFAANKPVGAICHGVLVAGRAGVLKGRRTTSLTNALELAAYRMTKLWLGDYYRTYTMTTEDEVRSFLAQPSDYDAGPSALLRDSPDALHRGFIVRDGNYVSARWPGDAHRFANELTQMLEDGT